jgi:hypothetical protein
MKCLKNSVFKKNKFLRILGSDIYLSKKILNLKISTFCEKNENKSSNIHENPSNSSNSSGISDDININYPEIIKGFFENNIKNKKLPCFEVYSSQIEILNQPFDFYLAIIVKKFNIYKKKFITNFK